MPQNFTWIQYKDEYLNLRNNEHQSQISSLEHNSVFSVTFYKTRLELPSSSHYKLQPQAEN
ncbi:hypothetical protein E2C01_018610 [Portunus trituberculatus]|uniref:Uncharacterized protein n=1 Tax=Portunus trituberculatus TaxID=210409 RepID=A0A5B7DX04_PORTR|nr:hypothetical protein [Portunus trituberculatus]